MKKTTRQLTRMLRKHEMKRKNIPGLSPLLIATLLLAACGNDPLTDEVKLDEAPKDSVIIAPEVLNDLVGAIPSPVELSTVLMSSGAGYNEGLLNPVNNVDKYSIAAEKAFNLGVYGADLAYINNNGKIVSSLNVLGSIKGLADDLRIGQFFDMATMKRLCTNTKNVDSLIYLSTSNFNAINEHLRTTGRSDLSVLMVCGAWVEGMHIAADAYRAMPSEELKHVIAEQKVVMDKLSVLLGAFPSDAYFTKLAADMGQVKAEFDRIDIKQEYRPPTKKVVNGRLIVQDNSTTTYGIPEGAIETLIAQLEELRTHFL
jgi:hypothetical protein